MHFLHWWPEITREAREHREAPEGSGYVIPMQREEVEDHNSRLTSLRRVAASGV